MQYGSYDPYHFSIASLAAPGEALDQAGIAAFISSHPSVDDQVERAMRDATILHELRHLHDSFGTLAGLTFFETHIGRLLAFARVLHRLKREGVALRLPLHAWAQTSSCPDYIQQFARDVAVGLVADAVYLGRTPPQDAAGHAGGPVFRQQWGAFPIPAFPLALKVFDLRDPTKAPVSTTRAIPIGLEQLMEGNAHALQRDVLRAVWSQEVEERVMTRMTQNRTLPTAAQSGVDDLVSQPYNITDLALTRHLNLQYGISEYPRQRLTELTDRALMIGRSLPHANRGEFSSPGGVFATLMEEVDWSHDLERRLFQEPEHDDRALVESLVDGLSQMPPPESLLKTRSIEDTVSTCHAFAVRHIALPLMRCRLEHGATALNSFDGYMTHYAHLPFAPIVSHPDGIATTAEMTKEMVRAWAGYAMFSQLALQVWQGADSLQCPRAFQLVPGLEVVDFYTGTGCNEAIDSNLCEEWRPGDQRVVPSCHFFFLLEMFGLR